MNKLTKVLSVFVIAGAIGTGVAGVVGCTTKKPTETCDHDSKLVWVDDNNGTTHHQECSDHSDYKKNENTPHRYDNDQDTTCNDCGYVRTVDDELEVAADVRALIVEEYGESEVQLSATKTSHSIDKSAIKVYFATGSSSNPVKGAEVPEGHFELELRDPSLAPATEWTGLKADGDYKIMAKLKNCKFAEGAPEALTIEMINATITVTVHNAIVEDSLVVKQGDGVKTTQVQSAINEMVPTWTYEVSRQNGDKEDVPAAEVTVSGVDTTQPTTSGVATLTWGTKAHGTQTYTITADVTQVAQSFAINFSYLTTEQETAIKNGEAITLQDGRFVVQSKTSGEIASHGKSFDGKYFAKRIKFNGASTASGTERYIKVHADGPATLTVYAYHNAGTEGTPSSARQVAVYKNFETGAPSNLVGTAQDTIEKKDTKHEFVLPEAGDYYICCVGNGLTFTYVQLDQMVAAGEGVSEIKLGGTVEVSSISAKHSSGETQHVTVGTAFDSIKTGYTVKATGVNNVTLDSTETDVTAEATFTPPADFATTIGEKIIEVSYGGVKTTFKVIVESQVEGIYGVTSALASTVNTQVSSASAKLTLHKSDIVNSLVGENANASITAYTVMCESTEVTEEGVEFAVSDSEYVLTVSVTVSDGTNTTTIVSTVKFTVSVASTDPVQSFVVPDELPSTTAVAEGATITESNLFKAVADGAMEYSIGKDASAGIPNSSKPVTAKLQDGTDKTFKTGLRTGATSTAGDPTTTVSITAKEKITLRIVAIFCNSSYNSNKTAKLSYKIGDGEATLVDTGSNRQTPNVIEVTLEAGQTLKLGAQNGSDNGHLYLFAIEATQITE